MRLLDFASIQEKKEGRRSHSDLNLIRSSRIEGGLGGTNRFPLVQLDEIPPQKQIKLLSQGSYGCIVRPSLSCSGKIATDKYITKIQKKPTTSERETKIGEMIKQIPDHSNFFAPVVETCYINMGQIDINEIKRCDFIKDPNNSYSSNKILYVGKYSLAEYLLYIFQKVPKIFFRELLSSYKYLLVGISKLNNIGVIHFDLKENNIMCRDKDGRPILIDFGLSITKELIEQDKKKAFFIYGPDYPTWCFDICLIGYIIHKIKDTDIITESVLSKVIDEYFLENAGIKELFSLEESNKYKQILTEYTKQFLQRTGADVINEVCLLCNSWDNYSMAIIYLNILRTMEIPDSPIVNKFIAFLKGIVLSVPNIRQTSEKSKQSFETEFNNISRVDNKKLLQILHSESSNITKNENRRSNIIKSIISDRKRENHS